MIWQFGRLLRRRAPHTSQSPRVLLLWWGSFPRGGETIGDYYSVKHLAEGLEARGLPCDVMTGAGLDFGPHRTMGYLAADPRAYGAAAFVCGPLVLPKIKRLLRPYRTVPKAALAVSLIGRREELDRWFERILERDSDASVHFDLALAADRLDPAASEPRRAAVCLRGKQREYGTESSLSEVADAACRAAAETIDPGFMSIDTILSPGNTVSAIEAQYRATSVLLTTRLHGCLFALLHRVPFVAVDQIKGGAKVTRLLARLGWPALFNAAGLSAATLVEAASQLEKSGWTADMEAIRSQAIALSQAMRDDCVACLADMIAANSSAVAT